MAWAALQGELVSPGPSDSPGGLVGSCRHRRVHAMLHEAAVPMGGMPIMPIGMPMGGGGRKPGGNMGGGGREPIGGGGAARSGSEARVEMKTGSSGVLCAACRGFWMAHLGEAAGHAQAGPSVAPPGIPPSARCSS